MRNRDVDVVIVGGGAAGVGAARQLAGSGLSTVLLEAGTRLGGRAWTQEVIGLDLDLGAGWLHSADRNSWARIAGESGIQVDQTPAAWGTQYRDLGFPPSEVAAARKAYNDWLERLRNAAPANDSAAAALEGTVWDDYIRIIASFVSGASLEKLSAEDFVAYDESSTEANWRLPAGYGALVAASFPGHVALHLATPVCSLDLEPGGVRVDTPTGAMRARAAILTVSSAVLAEGGIELPPALLPWREAASQLPLGRVEKMFLEITGGELFEPNQQLLGNPRDLRTASYYLRPFGYPVVECFLGGEGARLLDEGGAAAGYTQAIDQLASLLGHDVRKRLRPLITSHWSHMRRIGGAYSYALPGQAKARRELAKPFDGRVFFAGEATSPDDFSTAHGAHDSGVRAATEARAVLSAEPKPT
jgi:monoamine oxidase